MHIFPHDAKKRFRSAGKALAPALFLGFAVVLGGMRDLTSWAVFSAAFFVYLAFTDGEFSFSGTGLWGILTVWLAVGLAFSPEPLNSFAFFFRYIVLLAFFSLARRAGTKARAIWIGAVFALAAVACAAVLTIGVPVLMGSNVNYSMAFVAAACAGAVSLFLGARRPAHKFAWFLVLAALGVTLVAVNSRGAILGALAGSFSVFAQRRSLRPAAYFVIGVLLTVVLIPKEQFDWMLKLYDPRLFGRYNIWGSALGSITAHPVFGCGLGLFERAFELFKFPFYNGVSYYGHATFHAHSEPLNLAAEAGIPAALIFVAAWASGAFKNADNDAETGILKVFSVSMFVQAAVDIVFYSGALQTFFWGTMGLLSRKEPLPGCGNFSRDPGKCEKPHRRILAALVLCWCAAVFIGGASDRFKACALDKTLSPDEREQCLEKASVFSPGDTELLDITVPLSMAVHRNPVLAVSRLERAISMTPKNPFRYYEAADIYKNVGDPVSAQRMLGRALALEPDFLRARLMLSKMAATDGRWRAAAFQLGKIEETLDRDPAAVRPSRYDKALLMLPKKEYARLRKEVWRKP